MSTDTRIYALREEYDAISKKMVHHTITTYNAPNWCNSQIQIEKSAFAVELMKFVLWYLVAKADNPTTQPFPSQDTLSFHSLRCAHQELLQMTKRHTADRLNLICKLMHIYDASQWMNDLLEDTDNSMIWNPARILTPQIINYEMNQLTPEQRSACEMLLTLYKQIQAWTWPQPTVGDHLSWRLESIKTKLQFIQTNYP